MLNNPKWPIILHLSDDDICKISVTVGHLTLRSWPYKNEDERRLNMLLAREYVEGFSAGRKVTL